MNVIQIGSRAVRPPRHSRESDLSRLTFLVADAYRCYFLFSVVIILWEALENHYRLITTIVTVAEVSSGRVIEDVHRRLFVLSACQEKKEAKVKEKRHHKLRCNTLCFP